MNTVGLVLLFVAACVVAFAAADGGKSNGNLNPIFPPPPSPPNGFGNGGKDNYGKAGYLPPLDPNRQQLPIGPVDPSFGLMNIFGLIMPIVVLVGLGILLMPLIMGFFGGSGFGGSGFGGLGGIGGGHPLGAGYGVGGGPFFKRRSEGGFGGLNLSKENIMDLITTVSEAIDKVEKTFAKKKN